MRGFDQRGMDRTPMHKDKRFILTGGVMAAVILLSAFNRPPNEQVLTFLALTLAAFMGQSQWGQTKRATAQRRATDPVIPPAVPPPPPVQ